MQPQGLLHHGLEVTQARHVGLLDAFLAAEGVAYLRTSPGHGARVPEQLGHRPLHAERRRVAPGSQDVEEYGRQVVAPDLAFGDELQERVHEVPVRELVVVGCHTTVDYGVQYSEDFLEAPRRPATPPLEVETTEERDEVGDVGLGDRLDEVLHELPQPQGRV